MENCVVCLVQFCPSDQISRVQFTDEDSRRKKILRVFCSHFNLPWKQNENANDDDNENVSEEESESLSSFPFLFCAECRNLVVQLSYFQDQIVCIQKLVQKTITKITTKIIKSTSEKDRQNYSKADADSETQENGLTTRDKTNFKYRQRILQNFNPRVDLTNSQRQSQIEKSPKKIQSQTTNTNTNEINSTATEFENEQVSNNEDYHDNLISMDNVDVEAEDDRIEALEVEPSAEIPENSSSLSLPEEEQNDNLNLNSVSVSKKKKKNVIKKTSTKTKSKSKSNKKSKIPSLQNPSGAKDSSDLNSDKDNGNGDLNRNQKSVEDKMRSDTIENKGDGKFLYKKSWPFHIIDDSQFFQCDTCQSKIGFHKNPKAKIYTDITNHIIREHMSWSNNVEQNVEDGTFQFLDKCTFEKVDLGFKCGHCPKIYTKVGSLKRHIQLYHLPGEFQCPKCSVSCRTRGLITQHTCPRKLETRNQTIEVSPGKFIYNGKKQKWEFERLANGKFQCGSCGAMRKAKDKLVGHCKIYHDDLTTHMCDECGRIFKLKSSLDEHKRKHLIKAGLIEGPKSQTPVVCPLCGKTYKGLSGLGVHITSSHKDEDVVMTTITTATIQQENERQVEEEAE